MKTLTIRAKHEHLYGPLGFSWKIFWGDGTYMGPHETNKDYLKRIVQPGWDTMGWFTILLRF